MSHTATLSIKRHVANTELACLLLISKLQLQADNITSHSSQQDF